MAPKEKEKVVLLGGLGAPPTAADIVAVGRGEAKVAIDAGALKRLKHAPAEEAGDVSAGWNADVAIEERVPGCIARMALALKALELLKYGSKVRQHVVSQLRSLLNDALYEPIVSMSDGLKHFVEAFGVACKITDEERAIFLEEGAVVKAYATICTFAAKQLLVLSSGIVSLTAEACGADMRFLDQTAFESLGNKHAIAVSVEMRGVLEGSSVLTSSKGQRQSALFEVPFCHAIAKQALGELTKAVNLELGTPQHLFSTGKELLSVQTSTIEGLTLPFVQAVLNAVSLSVERSKAVMDLLPFSEENATGKALQPFVASKLNDVRDAHTHASREAVACAHMLLSTDGTGRAIAVGVCAAAAVNAMHAALLLEAFVAACAYRLKQGPHVEVAPAPTDAPAGGKGKKEKKKKKSKNAIGKGTAHVLEYFEASCMGGQGGLGDARLNAICGSELAGAPEDAFTGWYASLSKGLDWALGGLAPFLRSLQEIIEANQPRRKPKIAKGTRDFLPDQTKIRDGAFEKVIGVFKKHGAVSIDTPVFELRETLMGKYGEDTKLIYDLADQGGEILSLRYDLTVPFSRFVALHGCGNIKRYHVGKVYRRDQPQMTRGRFREFFQCDFDIAGTYASMVPDSEVLKVMVDILTDLDIGDFCIKLNHRLLLDAMMAVCGVPPQKFRPICSAIDKLDKSPWEEVRREMVEDKGLAPESADRIGQIVGLHGKPQEMLATLTGSAEAHLETLRSHPMAKAALDELTTLFDFLGAMNALDRISLDMSLARGLDYYTGVIYEAVLLGANVGSVAAGGRYDHLVGSFAGKEIPAVGVSIGLERIFAIIETKLKEEAKRTGVPIRSTDTAVLVASIGNGMQKRRMEVANVLWSAGISAEFGFKPNPKMGDQINYALESGIPFMVLFGEDEISQSVVKVKDMKERTEETVSMDDLVAVLKEKGAR